MGASAGIEIGKCDGPGELMDELTVFYRLGVLPEIMNPKPKFPVEYC